MMITRRRALSFLAILPVISVLSPATGSMLPKVYADDGIAIDGTDAVAYFTQGKPVAGSPKFVHEWMGVTWRFSTEENRAAFAADPEAYAPQYGGYCAYAVSEGYTASTVPEAWKIVDGKLYLNYSRGVQNLWEENMTSRISTANTNWSDLLK